MEANASPKRAKKTEENTSDTSHGEKESRRREKRYGTEGVSPAQSQEGGVIEAKKSACS